MQEEISDLIKHVLAGEATNQEVTLQEALVLETECQEWPESQFINKRYTGRVQVSYQPHPSEEQHGVLRLQARGEEADEHLIYENHSGKDFLGVVQANDTLRTYVKQERI